MEHQRISSRKNPLVKEASALGKASEKERGGLFLCEGARLCQDAARSGISILRCFYTEKALEKYGAYLQEIFERAESSFVVEDSVAALLSSTKTTQGVFCVCREPVRGEEPAGSCLVLEELQDPGNLGAVLRTAEALGVWRIFLLGDCCDAYSPKALRASMGAAFRLSPRRTDGIEELRRALPGFTFLAAVPERSALPVTSVSFSDGDYAVLVGNEGNGLRPDTIRACDRAVTIPMPGRAESLNASAAATILLWEMKR